MRNLVSGSWCLIRVSSKRVVDHFRGNLHEHLDRRRAIHEASGSTATGRKQSMEEHDTTSAKNSSKPLSKTLIVHDHLLNPLAHEGHPLRPPRLRPLPHISPHLIIPGILLLIDSLLVFRSPLALEILRFSRPTQIPQLAFLYTHQFP